MNPNAAAELAVLIPAWNEAQNLEALLPALWEVIAGLGLSAEIIVIDAGSSDGTLAAAARHGARAVLQTERGYGGALLAGFAATRAPYLVTMDADLSHRPVFIEEFWKRRGEAEVLIASRYVPGGRSQTHWLRRLLSVVLNQTYSRLLALPLRDVSSGFRMYRREVVATLEPIARDFDFLEEILIRIHKQGWRIREVPFQFMPRGTGRSHARLLRFGWAYLKTLWRMWRLRRA
jgi:dolichol-phosphate mannosyltransferase